MVFRGHVSLTRSKRKEDTEEIISVKSVNVDSSELRRERTSHWIIAAKDTMEKVSTLLNTKTHIWVGKKIGRKRLQIHVVLCEEQGARS
jgi:hypothetical protein